MTPRELANLAAHVITARSDMEIGAALTKEFNLCATSYALHIVRGPVWNAI